MKKASSGKKRPFAVSLAKVLLIVPVRNGQEGLST
jgi:hypothetical protein